MDSTKFVECNSAVSFHGYCPVFKKKWQGGQSGLLRHATETNCHSGHIIPYLTIISKEITCLESGNFNKIFQRPALIWRAQKCIICFLYSKPLKDHKESKKNREYRL